MKVFTWENPLHLHILKNFSRNYVCVCVYIYIYIYIEREREREVKVIPEQAEVAQGIPGRLRPRIFLTFGTTRVVGCQPYAPAAFTPREIRGTHFPGLSRPQGTWFRWGEPRKKSTVTRSRDRPTSSAVCVYIYIYIHIYTHTHTRTYVYTKRAEADC